MLTTPMVARFQRVVESSSATETLKLARRRSLRLRRTWRLSLSDCAASMWSSRVRKAMGISRSSQFSVLSCCARALTENWEPRTGLRDYFCRDAFRDEGFDYVAYFDVAVVCD